MITAPLPGIAPYVQSFFARHLSLERDLSPNTIASYRDAMKLFLAYCAERASTHVAELSFSDLGPDAVLGFLENVEKKRGCSVRTRNARLAALHTFYRYVAGQEPALLDLCQRFSAIPVKKTQASPPVYLEYDEVKYVLGTIDRTTALGRRDYLLLRLLFETGARAQEVATMRANAFRLSQGAQVRILGKGRKERICPLRRDTARLIEDHLAEREVSKLHDVPLFVGPRGSALTRHGILRAVQRRVRAAAGDMPSLAAKRVGAHTFRHAAAIHLLRSGNVLPVIRSWLGHVSVSTTDHYTEIDLDTKRRALDVSAPSTTKPLPRPPKRKADLM